MDPSSFLGFLPSRTQRDSEMLPNPSLSIPPATASGWHASFPTSAVVQNIIERFVQLEPNDSHDSSLGTDENINDSTQFDA